MNDQIVDVYSRNGFAGPATTLVRRQYAPDYTRVEGSYVPRRLETSLLGLDSFTDPRALPVTLLEGGDVQLAAWWRQEPTPFCLRNVQQDELHFVLSGTARLETDFGVLDLRPADFVLIPRAVTYRLSQVDALRELIVATASRLTVEPDSVPVVLNVDLDLDAPAPFANPEARPGEYELLVRHGEETTSYFYDRDPLPVAAVVGQPVVLRFNLEHVHGISAANGSLPPSRLINDQTTRTLLYYLGARPGGRAPVHHNADYDEIIVFAAGPGTYGAIDTPGTVTWTPKGVIHHGPDEDVPEGYVAWLLETRAKLRATPAGLRISRLMETSEWGIHRTDSAGRS
jgi:homogentisate 1,2-dioxygenase